MLYLYHNETTFHLLIIFYCKDLNFFTFTNFANCSTPNLIMLCILGNGGPRALADSNNESTRASVFWIARYHVHVYVDEVVDAYEKHIYADVITDTDAIATVQMYFQMHVQYIRTPKICKCKSNIATQMHL